MSSFRDVVGYFRAYRRSAILSILLTGSFEILDLAVPYAVGQILNVLSGQRLDQMSQTLVNSTAQLLKVDPDINLQLGVFVGIIFVISVLRAPLQPWLSGWFHWWIALKTRQDKSKAVVTKVLELPLNFYDENNPGRIAGRVAKGITNYTWTYPEIAGQFLPKLIRVLGVFIIIALIEPWVALVFGLSFVSILLFSLRHLQAIVRKENALDRYLENIDSRTSEIITNIKTVKSFANEGREFKRQQQRIDRAHYFTIHRIHRDYVILDTWRRSVIQMSLFGILVMTLWATVNGQISLGHFITTFTISSYAYAELRPLSLIAEVFARRYSSMVRFHELLNTPSGQDAARLVLDHSRETSYQFKGAIAFKQVVFGYNPTIPILKELDFEIQPRQTVALVGRSGSGKSTLVKLLFRYFQPDSGHIYLDGQDIQSLDVGQYRRRLAIVHQDVDIFNGTLLDNLKYGNPDATWQQVESACAIARVDEFIAELPQGYATIVGERGVRLSGGQRQRIGIARALIVNPDILVFDEATSSLDYESERSIQDAMHSILGTRTTIIIAHRLSTIRDADQIIVLDNGAIAELGSHQDLLSQGGLYRRLHDLSESGDLLD
ncbi:ABC transporter ATP-binding protein [Geitlerinema sp. P-1104]|uniref:ABC transporter ATP-binding protein n=1 Tax=Geitlerinema sp. P-1104 TaxID=2546230 RepID=UPI001476F802|nr:ABC transporter ATP-binding protein [Geitlerinema sp. P-1104]NMG57185.1 ABC transporter ATP-binding protein [Geitlerinema sp. P-1104]